jgi:hypothetical protein
MFSPEPPRNFVRKEVSSLGDFEGVFKIDSRELESALSIVEDKLGNQELFLILEDGERLRLNDYLPQGIDFKGSPQDKFSFGTQQLEHPSGETIEIARVSFDSELIDSVQGRLGLLHEIGHAIDYAENGDEAIELRYILRKIKSDIINSVEFGWMDESDEKKDYFLKEFKEKWRNAARKYTETEGLRFRYMDLIEALKELVRSERAAWSNGLNLYRKIKSERNIDLLEGANVLEVFDTVDRALTTYEQGYGSIIDDYNSKGPIRRFVEGRFL